MARICLFAFVAVCCLAVLTSADPTRNNGDRNRSGGVRHFPAATSFAGAHAHHAPARAAPENRDVEVEQPAEDEPAEDELQEQEQPEQDAEEEPAPTPVKPRKPSYPGRKQPKSEGHQGGVTAIANSASHGAGAKSHSRSTAYGGHYTGGHFGGDQK